MVPIAGWAAFFADLIGICLPIILKALQQNADTPTIVHDAIPTPEIDAVVGDAMVDGYLPPK